LFWSLSFCLRTFFFKSGHILFCLRSARGQYTACGNLPATRGHFSFARTLYPSCEDLNPSQVDRFHAQHPKWTFLVTQRVVHRIRTILSSIGPFSPRADLSIFLEWNTWTVFYARVVRIFSPRKSTVSLGREWTYSDHSRFARRPLFARGPFSIVCAAHADSILSNLRTSARRAGLFCSRGVCIQCSICKNVQGGGVVTRQEFECVTWMGVTQGRNHGLKVGRGEGSQNCFFMRGRAKCGSGRRS
jgi:hypothetical protein